MSRPLSHDELVQLQRVASQAGGPAMPPEMRGQVIAWSVAQPDPIHAALACFWLLDPAAPLRLAAARALADRAADGTLSADVAGKLATLRSWMPGDEARAAVDAALRSAMRAGIAAEPAKKPWTIHRILATLPDGGGAQSVMIALQSGGRRKTAMLLLKHGHGIKDAYAILCASATEQKALLQRITDETGAVPVPEGWLPRALAMALADGLASDLPPAPGLVEIAALCGPNRCRPQRWWQACPARTAFAPCRCTEVRQNPIGTRLACMA